MQFLSLEPFVPSGPDMEKAKEFFLAIGFSLSWDGVDYCGFQFGNCKFILQKYDNKEFAENFMISIRVDDINACREKFINSNVKKLFGTRFTEIMHQPYGKEVNLIDPAGVCWHFVEG